MVSKLPPQSINREDGDYHEDSDEPRIDLGESKHRRQPPALIDASASKLLFHREQSDHGPSELLSVTSIVGDAAEI